MQPVKFLKFLRQFVVLVERNLQLIWNDKLLLASLTLQSPFMVLVVKLTADPNCFTSNLVNIGSRTALFVLAAMATFMGTLNSYREICREREIILREASVGVSLPAVVLSKAAVLLLVEVLQAAILAFGFVSIVHVPQNHLLLETDMEIFITVLLTMFSSSCIGLLISALFTSGESAILAVLVLMIGQVVFSNIMFTVTGAAATISASVTPAAVSAAAMAVSAPVMLESESESPSPPERMRTNTPTEAAFSGTSEKYVSASGRESASSIAVPRSTPSAVNIPSVSPSVSSSPSTTQLSPGTANAAVVSSSKARIQEMSFFKNG